MNSMTNFFSEKRRLFTFLVLAIVVLAIPLTVILSGKQQEIRQRAEGEQLKLYFTDNADPANSELKTFAISSGENKRFSLWLDPQGQSITGFDISIFAKNLNLSDIAPSTDAQKFDISIAENFTPDQNESSYRLAKFYTGEEIFNQKLHLLDFSVYALYNSNARSFGIKNANITGLSSKDYLSAEKPSLSTFASAKIEAPTPTSTPAPACNYDNKPDGCGSTSQWCYSGNVPVAALDFSTVIRRKDVRY